MSQEAIANVIALGALLLSIYSVYISKKTENRSIKESKLSSLEQKLDFIIANYTSRHFILYKTASYQTDLKGYCQEYKLDLEKALKLYAKIYFPITNDGQDIELSIQDVQESAVNLLNYLKQ